MHLGDDPASGELASERWNPSQNVRTILLSVISLLNEPNCSSPANVDASVLYRKYKDANQKKKRTTEYAKLVLQQVIIHYYLISASSINEYRLHDSCIQVA